MEYYCERVDTDKPYFTHYTGKFNNAEEAVKFFKEKHGSKLECVYDENFKMVYEA